MKSAEFLLECGRAKCFSQPNELIFNTMFNDNVCLKMIGKGFVLFKINSSPSAFYIIKPTCIVIGF